MQLSKSHQTWAQTTSLPRTHPTTPGHGLAPGSSPGQANKPARGEYLYMSTQADPSLQIIPGQSADAPTACPWPDPSPEEMVALRAAL